MNDDIAKRQKVCDDGNCAVCQIYHKNYCIDCKSPKVQSNGKCVETCPAGTFDYNVKGSIRCSDCSKRCKTCKGKSTKCTSCKSGLLLQEDYCLEACGNGFETLDS